MQKIISLFQRNYDTDRLVRDEVTPGAEWVINGEGIATRKWDGSPCKIEKGVLYKRYDAKKGKTPPVGFIPAQDPDPVTGHWPGWIAIPPDDTNPENKWHREAYMNTPSEELMLEGTFELVGPRINGNRDGFEKHFLIPHGNDILERAPRTFNELKDWLDQLRIEGIVWHHPDGRMVKIKKRDFGLKW